MARKALVHNGEIIQIENKVFDVHKDLKWIDIDDLTKIGDQFDGAKVIKKPDSPLPPEPDYLEKRKIDKAKEISQVEINEAVIETMNQLKLNNVLNLPSKADAVVNKSLAIDNRHKKPE